MRTSLSLLNKKHSMPLYDAHFGCFFSLYRSSLIFTVHHNYSILSKLSA